MKDTIENYRDESRNNREKTFSRKEKLKWSLRFLYLIFLVLTAIFMFFYYNRIF